MNKLLATTLESKIHVYDMRTQNDAHGGFASVTEKAHSSTVWLGKHLPQNREIFMTCGGGGTMAQLVEVVGSNPATAIFHSSYPF